MFCHGAFLILQCENCQAEIPENCKIKKFPRPSRLPTGCAARREKEFQERRYALVRSIPIASAACSSKSPPKQWRLTNRAAWGSRRVRRSRASSRAKRSSGDAAAATSPWSRFTRHGRRRVLRLLSSSVVDENAAHGLGGGGEEMSATIPRLHFRGVDKSQVGFVDECRRL